MTVVRTRFAPSPTGSMHIGGARTALYNYLFARQNHGQFILRIEDTDQKRLVPGAQEQLMESLKKLGLTWHEGPDRKDGAYGPYVQSERLDIYRDALDKLYQHGFAYPCYCTPEQLAADREEQIKNKQPLHYVGRCRNGIEADHGQVQGPCVWRFAMNREGTIEIEDSIRGKLTFRRETLDDFVLVKSDGYPTYHFANVVDDHFMDITHVLRGEEWLSSAPLHKALYDAFSWTMPILVHLPLILSPDGGKLSKRHGAASLEDFFEQGYTPQALMNYLALLGWNSGTNEELFSRKDLIWAFRLERVRPAAAKFDYKKLDWFNKKWLQEFMGLGELDDLTTGLMEATNLPEKIPPYRAKMLRTMRKRYTSTKDIVSLLEPLYFLHNYDTELLVPEGMTQEGALSLLHNCIMYFEEGFQMGDDDGGSNALIAYLENVDSTIRKQASTIIRVALYGDTKSPPAVDLLNALDPQAINNRLIQARSKLRTAIAATMPLGGTEMYLHSIKGDVWTSKS